MTSRVLVVNAGSSSLKFKLFDWASGNLTPAVSGLLERIGDSAASTVTLKGLASGTESAQIPLPDHATGLQHTFSWLREKVSATIVEDVKAVGHRVVHGGALDASTILTPDARAEVQRAAMFAPLHNAAHLTGVDACEAFFSGRPQVGVFDTAFHQTMPPSAYLYALPKWLHTDHGVRRFGMHGTSYRYLTDCTSAFLQRPADELNLIIAHLGAGSSMCCVRGGKSVDTSMGMTPLEGLVMGTRCGDIDPGLLPFLGSLGHSIARIDKLMNKESGLLGLAGASDLRTVEEQAAAGDEDSKRALEVFVHRVRKYLGAYLLHLDGRADAIVFSAGIGENAAGVRSAVCANLHGMGIEIDEDANRVAGSHARCVSTSGSRIKVLVVPTDEELCIAQDTARLASL